jgi:hypothetical protein
MSSTAILSDNTMTRSMIIIVLICREKAGRVGSSSFIFSLEEERIRLTARQCRLMRGFQNHLPNEQTPRASCRHPSDHHGR